VAFRDDSDQHDVRLGTITAGEVFATMLRHRIGMSCPKCAERKMRGGFYRRAGKYCSAEHSGYYQKIMRQLYECPEPFSGSLLPCPRCNRHIHDFSRDHILPITRGGLEFDRQNLQWMCLPCNIAKGNRSGDEIVMTSGRAPSRTAPRSKLSDRR
jgi:5-methylcytosine-specific restriction endonuclease McrA